jgi:hypothetical protein
VQKGPFLFSRIDHYSVTHLTGKADQYDTVHAIHHVSYPRIDQPVAPITTRWNQLAVRTDQGGDCDSGDGDTSTGYSLGLVTPRLTSVTWSEGTYCHGAPHGYGGNVVETLILLPSSHPFQPAYLFQMDKPWSERLMTLALPRIRNAALADHYATEGLDESAIANAASNSVRWSLQPDGLAMIFEPYELGLGYPFHPDVTIPWSDLRDLMVLDPPVP